MADAILNSKISLAKSKVITVKVDANIPVKLKMSELDLCVILGNLFDNAIDANLPLPQKQRMIRVYMVMKNTQLYISFTNISLTSFPIGLTSSFSLSPFFMINKLCHF